MQDDSRKAIGRLAALVGVALPGERIAALATILPFVQAGTAALAGVDYREAEPAARFRPRPQAPR